MKKFKIHFCLIISFLSIPFRVLADDMPVPSKTQSAFFLKILSYNKTIKGDVKIGVLQGSLQSDVLSAFNSASGEKIGNSSFSVTSVSIGEIALKDLDVLYITPGNKDKLDDITKVTKSNGILSITGVPEYVEYGPVSVGLGLKLSKKPEIIVNLNSSKSEKQDFGAQLLKLAKIVN